MDSSFLFIGGFPKFTQDLNFVLFVRHRDANKIKDSMILRVQGYWKWSATQITFLEYPLFIVTKG